MAFGRDAGPRHTSKFPPRLWFLVYLDSARPREGSKGPPVLKGTPVARRYCQESITRSADYYGTQRRSSMSSPLALLR